MSSSKLFEITKKPHSAIFSVLSRSHYMGARKACIQAILATDTALHFQNVKKAEGSLLRRPETRTNMMMMMMMMMRMRM